MTKKLTDLGNAARSMARFEAPTCHQGARARVPTVIRAPPSGSAGIPIGRTYGSPGS